jgi:class 3 adenylate cyclase
LLDKHSILEVQLGDQVEKEMTILFSDIREFTSLSENMTPQDNFKFINAYLSRMEPIIAQHNGFIDKYIGDAIMALFPNANDAVQAALGMLNRLTQYNMTRGRPGRPIIKIGIGLNTGSLMLGTVGGENRMEGTVISDAVNLASRVEDLTKIYNTALLITEQTYLKLKDPWAYQIRVIDAVIPKGKSEEVTIYEIFDADFPESLNLKYETRDNFELGFVLYHSEEMKEAKVLFEKVLAINQHDKAAQVYLKRCEHFPTYNA